MSGWSVRKYITIGKRVLITDSFKFQPDSGGRVVPNAPRGAYTCTERRYGVETTSFPKIFDLEVTLGLDTCTGVRCQCTAGEHRLLDQRIAFETNCQVASQKTSPIYGGHRGVKTVIPAEIILAGSWLDPCCVLAEALPGENHPHIWTRRF